VVKGLGRGKACKFPFTKDGTLHHKCKAEPNYGTGRDQYICATARAGPDHHMTEGGICSENCEFEGTT
jgi:hypothetical protein